MFPNTSNFHQKTQLCLVFQLPFSVFGNMVKHSFLQQTLQFRLLPPLTSPFVHTADMERVVTTVTSADNKIMTADQPIPAWPTTHVSRRNSITPQMFNRHRSMTPFNQPNFGAALTPFGSVTCTSLLLALALSMLLTFLALSVTLEQWTE